MNHSELDKILQRKPLGFWGYLGWAIWVPIVVVIAPVALAPVVFFYLPTMLCEKLQRFRLLPFIGGAYLILVSLLAYYFWGVWWAVSFALVWAVFGTWLLPNSIEFLRYPKSRAALYRAIDWLQKEQQTPVAYRNMAVLRNSPECCDFEIELQRCTIPNSIAYVRVFHQGPVVYIPDEELSEVASRYRF